MERRLKIAHNLIKNDGVTFISIDKNEFAQLKLLCDEIYGEDAFVTIINVEMSATQGMKVKAAKSGVRTAMKKVRVAVEAKDLKAAEEALLSAERLIDKSDSDGIQHKNTGARQKSEIRKLVNSLK